MKLYIFNILLAALATISQVAGHGYMFSPINRASRWRLDENNVDILRNYKDDEYSCGGASVQYNINDGKCGPCGDDFRDPIPRSNENGGTYGNGIVVETYTAGSIITTAIEMTIHNMGKMFYQLCKLSDPNLPETEECFQPLTLSDGSYFQEVTEGDDDGNITSSVKLPDDLVCDRCVLRWHYEASNTIRACDNGTADPGCGLHETFRSCADISILPRTRLIV